MRYLAGLLTALCLFTLLVPAVSAHGVSPKGVVLGKNVSVSGTTGSCDCVWRWYTLGANPGTLRIQARIEKVGHVAAGSYGIQMYLFQGTRPLKIGQVGCMAHGHCSDIARLSYKVPNPTIYYLRVSGPGVLSISYKLVATGSTRTLHCSRYC